MDFNVIEYKVNGLLENYVDALSFDRGTSIAHMVCEISNIIIDINLIVSGYSEDEKWFESFYVVKRKDAQEEIFNGSEPFEENLCEYNEEKLKDYFLEMAETSLGYNGV